MLFHVSPWGSDTSTHAFFTPLRWERKESGGRWKKQPREYRRNEARRLIGREKIIKKWWKNKKTWKVLEGERGEENKGLAAPQKASGGMEDGDGMKNMPVAGGENQNQLITGRSAGREREEEGKHVETTPRRQQFGIPTWIRSVVKAIPSA